MNGKKRGKAGHEMWIRSINHDSIKHFNLQQQTRYSSDHYDTETRALRAERNPDKKEKKQWSNTSLVDFFIFTASVPRSIVFVVSIKKVQKRRLKAPPCMPPCIVWFCRLSAPERDWDELM